MKAWGLVCDEDIEDFEQEKLIQEWLRSTGNAGRIELKHTTSKGTARNTLIKAAISLDEKMSDNDDSGTYADLIAGSDGRDLEYGEPDDSFEREIEELQWTIQAIICLASTKSAQAWAEIIYKQWCEQQTN